MTELVLLISNNHEKITTLDGMNFLVSNVTIKNHLPHLTDTRLQDATDLPHITRVLFLRRKFGILQIKLGSKDLCSKTAEFINQYHSKQNLLFDCYSFVCMFCNIQKHNKIDLEKFWKINKWKRSPSVGDILFLISKMDDKHDYFHHAAIYLGDGLFISVYGAGGDIEVSTLNDMQRDYSAQHALHATPLK